MKTYFSFLVLAFLLFGAKVEAVCPVCTVAVGAGVGFAVGFSPFDDGAAVGWRVGCLVGWRVGWPVGCRLGWPVGLPVGCRVGCLVGCPVGCLLGREVGCLVGWRDGFDVGSEYG
jgi:hypothetical protein